MKITSINPITTNNNYKYRSKQNYVTTVSGNFPTFKAGLTSGDCYRGRVLLNKFKFFTKEEYKKFTEQEINDINAYINNYINSLSYYTESFQEYLLYHDMTAEGLRSIFDSVYGQGKYIVIPIGRSFSSIGKCLGYKIGEDNVKPLPMSNARRFQYFNNCKNENFTAFREYLDSIGLSEKEVKSSGKNYIFMDYSFSRRVLAGMKNLFKSDKMWGDIDNIHFEDVTKCLFDFRPPLTVNGVPLNKPEYDRYLDDLEIMFSNEEFKNYSIVKECNTLYETKNKIVNPEEYSDKTKSLFFKLLYNEMTKQKNK